MSPKFFIGIDISKATLDLAVFLGDQKLSNHKIRNTETAFLALLIMLKERYKISRHNTVFCAEEMGLYGTFILSVAKKKKLLICMESPLRIHRSSGIIRGKSDKADAERISLYLQKNHKSLKWWVPFRDPIFELKTLSTIRKRLLKIKVMMTNNEKMTSYYYKPNVLKYYSAFTVNTSDAILKDIASVNERMLNIILNDEILYNMYNLITSVPQIGPVIATQFIIYTNEFKNFTCPKKFASYCGVAPFSSSSGTSLNKKARTLCLGNTEFKTHLHLASLGYTRRKNANSALGRYYIRRVQEGKSKMSVLNAIRNKLILIVFSCIRKNTPFQDLINH